MAIGLVFTTGLSSRLGHIDPSAVKRLENLLTRVGLPIRAPASLNIDEIKRALLHDKKRQKNEIKLVLPTDKLGKVDYSYRIDTKQLTEQIEAFLQASV